VKLSALVSWSMSGSVSEPSDEPNDPYDALAVIAEEATDRAEYLYELLSDLQKQTFLGALAGLYHQWDKDLRHFVYSHFGLFLSS